MAITIPIYPHRNRTWFFVRKALFQLILPAILALISFFDYLNSSTEPTYASLYFYTTLTLLAYTGTKATLKYIFDVCADITVFQKPVDLNNTVPNIVMLSDSNTNGVMVIRKIFKLRYSAWPSFVKITQACWLLGLDCPILVPFELIKDLDVSNEELSLQATLERIYNFHPVIHNLDGDATKQVVLKSDQTICDVKRGLFN